MDYQERTDAVFQMIVRSRRELQLPMLTREDMEKTAEVWITRLHSIPDRFLDEAYEIAMNNHKTRAPLIPNEIRDAWESSIAKRPEVHFTPDRQEPCPNRCSRDGWMSVDADGVVQTDSTTADYIYSKPCPIHRPNAKTFSTSDPGFGPRLHRPVTINSPEEPKPHYPSSAAPAFKSAGDLARNLFPESED